MNIEQYLLIKLGEECNEVAQRCSKALVFGCGEVQKDHFDNNAERITQEFEDLLGVYEMLVSASVLKKPRRKNIKSKINKVIKYMDYSRKLGILK